MSAVTQPSPTPFPCVLEAWRTHEHELRAFLVSDTHDPSVADDVLQDVFLKALRAGTHFCALESPRAWLFQVARHALIDRHRLRKPTVPVPDSLAAPESALAPVDALAACLQVVLETLDPDDRDVIERCDIEGDTQRAYSDRTGLSLPAVKSRILRARGRLRERLIEHCGVRFDPAGRVCCSKDPGPSGS